MWSVPSCAESFLGTNAMCTYKTALTATSSNEFASLLLVEAREFNSEAPALQYPSGQLVLYCEDATNRMLNLLLGVSAKSGVSARIALALEIDVDFSWFNCDTHRETMRDYIIQSLCRIYVPWWGKLVNRGTSQRKSVRRAAYRKLLILWNQ
uniref:Long-chain fatty acid transport protein 3 n=1 Tax=Lygus hesperus TaxID=30085 RepID=A0A0A9X951_LYGHE